MFGFQTARRRLPLSVLALLCLSPTIAHAHRSHSRHAHGGGVTYCTYYRDRHGRTATNLAPRGSWILLSRGGTSMRVRVTDTGCSHFDLTPAQFKRFAPLSHGVVRGVQWRVLSHK